MSSTLIAEKGREAPPPTVENSPGIESAWDVLERFGQSIQACEDSVQQIRLVLASVQESLNADAVFWYSGTGTEEFQVAGSAAATEEWCRAFAERVLADVPAGQVHVLKSFLDPASRLLSPWPACAALVRLSKSRQLWLAALSFDAQRLFGPVDIKVMMLARRILLNHRQHAVTHERLRESLFGLVRCLTAAIDAKDPYTWGHSERVARIAVRVAQQMSLPAAFQSDLYLAGLLHDVGKIGIRDAVLMKPGKLTPEEFAHIQEHPVIGDRLVSNVAALQHVRPGVRNHHERWDGQGYPDRLAGEAIPFLARVLAVADSCDAMMAIRPYRPAMPAERIDAILQEGSGTQWDPRVITHFMECRKECYSICQRGLGESVTVAVDRAITVGTREY